MMTKSSFYSNSSVNSLMRIVSDKTRSFQRESQVTNAYNSKIVGLVFVTDVSHTQNIH